MFGALVHRRGMGRRPMLAPRRATCPPSRGAMRPARPVVASLRVALACRRVAAAAPALVLLAVRTPCVWLAYPRAPVSICCVGVPSGLAHG